MAIEKVGVVGCGLMGAGIAQVSAAAGFSTMVREVGPELLDKGIKGIEKNLARLVEKGAITDVAKGEIRGRLEGTTVIEDLKGCDLVIEAIIEQLPAKRDLFATLDRICPEKTIFASNTSTLTGTVKNDGNFKGTLTSGSNSIAVGGAFLGGNNQLGASLTEPDGTRLSLTLSHT